MSEWRILPLQAAFELVFEMFWKAKRPEAIGTVGQRLQRQPMAGMEL